MLSNTDVHYISAFLYVASEGVEPTVVLGAKLYDVAARERRDVDIAISSAGSFGVAAAEVKNHARPLDASVVEGLCRKLADMPEVQHRAIVSSSGYTEGARRKAAFHDVRCLSLQRGQTPRFVTIDLSELSSIKVEDTDWEDGPHITFAPSVVFSDRERRRLSERTMFRFRTFELPASDVVSQMRQQINFDSLPYDSDGLADVDETLPFAEPGVIQVGKRTIAITEARLCGVVRRTFHRLPASDSCYLSDEDSAPFAAVLLFESQKRLIGVTSSGSRSILRTFLIPNSLRSKRPVRIKLNLGTA